MYIEHNMFVAMFVQFRECCAVQLCSYVACSFHSHLVDVACFTVLLSQEGSLSSNCLLTLRMMMMMMIMEPITDIISPLAGAAATDETFEGLRSEALARICCFAGASVQGRMSARCWEHWGRSKTWSWYRCNCSVCLNRIAYAKYDAVGYWEFVEVCKN